eukprot:353466-Chlamydomonas_euryale.AAC.9
MYPCRAQARTPVYSSQQSHSFDNPALAQIRLQHLSHVSQIDAPVAKERRSSTQGPGEGWRRAGAKERGRQAGAEEK